MAAGDRKMLTFLFHLSVFTAYMYTLIYETIYIANAPHKQSYAGRFKFLTFWNQVCCKSKMRRVRCGQL